MTGRRVVMIGSDGRTHHRLAALVAAFAGLPLIQDPRRAPGPGLADAMTGGTEVRTAALRSWVDVTTRRQALAVERAGSFLANGSVLPALLLALIWRLDDCAISDSALRSLSSVDTALLVEPPTSGSEPVGGIETVLRRQAPGLRVLRMAGDAEDPLDAARRARDALLAD